MKDMGTGRRLTALRERAGLTKSALARKAKLDQTTTYRIESGIHQGTSVRVRRGLATAFAVPTAKLSAYLDGYIALDELVPDPQVRSPLDIALESHRDGRWSKSTVDAARRLPLRGLSVKDWAEQLDDMEAAYQARPTVWDRLIDPKYDIQDGTEGATTDKPKKAPIKKAKKRSNR